jgi:Tol biopolymer transport system component
MHYLAFPRIAPDGHAVVTRGSKNGRGAIYLIDAATGQTSEFASNGNSPEWSADGLAILYQEQRGDNVVLLEREVGTSAARDVFQTTAANTLWVRRSPDERHVAFVRWDPDSKASTFNVASLPGGTPRVLLSEAGSFPIDGQRWQWARDSASVFVTKALQDGGLEIWQLPLNGPARKLDIDTRQWTDGFSIDADGGRVAFAGQAGKTGYEVWALENFLPGK